MTVYQRQCLLAYLGYSPGAVDGVDGEKTQGAVARFQRDAGLMPDGCCGPETEAALLRWVTEGRSAVTDDWWQTIRHFRREEFRCKCGGQFCNGYPAEMQRPVVEIADAAREHFDRPAYVVSGLRCQRWNAHEGGVANSQHMRGEAIDLRVEGIDAETLRRFVSTQPRHRYSYCINGTNVHFDIT